MQKNYNVTGEQRKKMVQIISQEVGMEPVYMRMPTCAYAISNITVGKAGEMVWDERTDEKVIAKVMDTLAAAGFTVADPEPGAPAEESGEETGTPEDEGREMPVPSDAENASGVAVPEKMPELFQT